VAASRMLEDKALEGLVAERYAGWQGEEAQKMLAGDYSLDEIAAKVTAAALDPQPRSGKQEL
ncbi:MAG: xylose isomerase, partial [Gammaproteobacteria bacterium]|nr:xylose isomerase [Gammaproteobacteria bacterium]